MPDYDVIVVGAGPAGSVAAYTLATSGIQVALLEQSTFPRDKACGDLLGPTSTRQVYEMGLTDLIERHRPAPTWNRIMDIIGDPLQNAMRTADQNQQLSWMTIPRFEFDAALASRSQQAGAHLIERIQVTEIQPSDDRVELHTLDTHNAVLHCRLVIIATGSASRFTTGDVEGVAIRGYFHGEPSDDFILRWQADLAPGYEWLFPLPETGVFNIGLGTTHAQARALKLIDRLYASPLLKDKVLNGRLKGGLLNVSYANLGQDKCFDNRTLRIGDAAGLILPHSGEGIGPAIISARIAATVAIEALQSNMLSETDLAVYRERLDEQLGQIMAMSKKLSEATKFPRILKQAILYTTTTPSHLAQILI